MKPKWHKLNVKKNHSQVGTNLGIFSKCLSQFCGLNRSITDYGVDIDPVVED